MMAGSWAIEMSPVAADHASIWRARITGRSGRGLTSYECVCVCVRVVCVCVCDVCMSVCARMCMLTVNYLLHVHTPPYQVTETQ